MNIENYIDHTVLGFTVTSEDIKRVCKEAKENHFASVVVPPSFVEMASQELKESSVAVCTTVGFPLGNSTIGTKVYEAKEAIENGADEIDMVINIGALKEKSYDYIIEEITSVRDNIGGKVLKVIIETSLLNEEEIKEAVIACNLTFINYVKTSTGYGPRGATAEDIEIINSHKNEVLEVKASGGIKTYNDAIKFITLGVDRIGTSSGINIMKGVE